MSTCSSCGTANPDEAIECFSCGAPLGPAAAKVVGAEVPPDTYINPEPVDTALKTASPEPAYTPPPAYAPVAPDKDRSIALILEILPGLFGLLGIGWLYAGKTQTGIIWLVAFLIWTAIASVISVLTVGIGAICWLPVSIACIVVSAVNLNKFTQANPDRFK